MKINLRITIALGAMLLTVVSLSPAQSRSRYLDKDTFFDMESVGNPSISPDGKQIVFSRTWVDKLKDQYRSTLWIVDVDNGRVRELTTGNRSDSAPAWSPDGKRIAFLSDRDGTNQLHVMWVDTREIAQLTRSEYPPTSFRWSPDGNTIAFTAFIPDNDPILNVKLPERPRGAEWARPAVIVDRLQWGADGRGPLPRGFSHAFVVDAVLGGTPRQITSGKFNHASIEWARDGKTVYGAVCAN
jgi:dipeptidyl aminopeptidase/acylaminoacyl peptidase